MKKQMLTMLLVLAMLASLLSGCGNTAASTVETDATVASPAEETAAAEPAEAETAEAPDEASAEEDGPEETSAAEEAAEPEEVDHGALLQDTAAIEDALNLANNPDQTWTYSASTDGWTLAIVTAVADPEIAEKEGVSVCVPGAYVTGIDTDGDGVEDVTAADQETAEAGVAGSLVIDYDAEVVSSNGQVYTAATAPCILNTGAAGYSSSTNTLASGSYATEGYINVACGNRGKQDSIEDENGEVYYTGDAPSCLCDQKAAARFVKYNILLGNLPGSTEYWVSTGGSGGGAHATMFAATSNNPDFYDYQIAVGAVGVYQYEDGSYSTTVTIDGVDYDLSDGAWGCVAYSAITSLAEADMTMAFEYYMDTEYDFGSSFQKQLAAYLSQEYMEYINAQNLSVKESDVGFDLDGDGAMNSEIALTIEYDESAYADTNGYGGSYLDLYLAEFHSNLEWYLANLSYADGWTWFDADGNALSDEAVAAMTDADRAEAFLEGRYTESSSGGMGGPPDGGAGGPMGDPPDGGLGGPMDLADGGPGTEGTGDAMVVGTPDAGTTQSASGGTDSANYSSYEDMLAAYEADIAEVTAGDEFGKNQVELYNPLNYIGAEETEDPTWVRIMMGAAEGDISMFNSLNMQILMLNAGVAADIQWQWDGGHVPSEIFDESLALTVDTMYGEFVDGAVTGIKKADAEPQTANGDSEEMSGTDISDWVSYDAADGTVEFSLHDAAVYRVAGASKAIPGFDVMDYGQEDYVFGSHEADARHWDQYVLKVLQEHAEDLSELFNAE